MSPFILQEEKLICESTGTAVKCAAVEDGRGRESQHALTIWGSAVFVLLQIKSTNVNDTNIKHWGIDLSPTETGFAVSISRLGGKLTVVNPHLAVPKIPRPSPKSSSSESLDGGPGNPHFNKFPRWIPIHIKLPVN